MRGLPARTSPVFTASTSQLSTSHLSTSLLPSHLMISYHHVKQLTKRSAPISSGGCRYGTNYLYIIDTLQYPYTRTPHIVVSRHTFNRERNSSIPLLVPIMLEGIPISIALRSARTLLRRRMRMGRLRRKPLKISLPNRNRNIIRAHPTAEPNGRIQRSYPQRRTRPPL